MVLLIVYMADTVGSSSGDKSEAVQAGGNDQATDGTPSEAHDLNTDTSSKSSGMEGISSQDNKRCHQAGGKRQAE